MKQLSKHALHLKDIGHALGFSLAEMGNIEGRPLLMGNAPTSWLSEMLLEYLHWKLRDARRSPNYANLTDLKTALRKAKLNDTAKSLVPSVKLDDNH